MGSAIIDRMVSSGFKGSEIFVIDPNEDKRQKLSSQFGVATHAEPGDWLANVGNIVLAVKPQQLPDAIRQIKPYIEGASFISIAAGVQTADLSAMLQTKKIARVMPNTPIKVGLGVCGIFLMDPQLKEITKKIFGPCGEVIWCDREPMLESITAISGSGPAYVFFFMESLEKAAIGYGFNAGQARALAVSTVLGSSRLAKESPESLGTLRERVTSKGGTTHEALKVLGDKELTSIMQEAMDACRRRAVELGEAFHKTLEVK